MDAGDTDRAEAELELHTAIAQDPDGELAHLNLSLLAERRRDSQ